MDEVRLGWQTLQGVCVCVWFLMSQDLPMLSEQMNS